MSAGEEKKGNFGRKWGIRIILVVIVVLLLLRCGGGPGLMLSGDGEAPPLHDKSSNSVATTPPAPHKEKSAPHPKDDANAEIPSGQTAVQGEAEAVTATEEEDPAKSVALVPVIANPGGAGSKPSIPAAGEPLPVLAQPLLTEASPLVPPVQEPVARMVESDPLPQGTEELRGESYAGLEDGLYEEEILEGPLMCPGAPTVDGLISRMGESPGNTFTDPFTEMTFIRIKGGCFKMGSNSGGPEERPVHEVCVDDFYMGEYEVTQAEYEWVMWHNPSYYKRCELPVESVSWEDAQTFIGKLRKASGRNYRLPSEAEWEYAARRGWIGDTEASINEALLMEYAGYVRNIGVQDDPFGPNGLGLYGMDTNVWEWVSDWYGSDYYARSPRTNPKGPSSGSARVLRAGIEVRSPEQFAKRYGAPPDERQDYFGFRLVFPADSLPEVFKVENSDSAAPGSPDDVPAFKMESASGPHATQPLL